MNNRMTRCRSCGQEIAKSASICPHCGSKNKRISPILIGTIIFFVLICIVASAGDNDKPTKVEPSGENKVEATTVAKADENTVFLVGETAELRGVAVTLVNVSESTGSAYNTPTDGNIFLLCEFEIANNSNAEITVSSMMCFEAYCDDYVCPSSITALLEKGSKNQLDGTVAVGKKFNGVIGYEVPADWAELEVRFTPDFWSGKDIIFVANR